MKAPFSTYLDGMAPGLKKLISILREKYDYVSVLATDSSGFEVSISQRSKGVKRETLTSERGTVVRVYRNGLYSEAAFTGFDPEKAEEKALQIAAELDTQIRMLEAAGIKPYETAALPDAERTIFAEMETDRLPEDEDLAALVERMSRISVQGMKDGEEQGIRMIDCRTRASSTHVCKMFLTENQDLRQSYVFSEGMCAGLVAGEERTGGRRGPAGQGLHQPVGPVRTGTV